MAATTQAFGIYHLSPSAFLQLTYLTWHELLSFEECQYGKKPHLSLPPILYMGGSQSTIYRLLFQFLSFYVAAVASMSQITYSYLN